MIALELCAMQFLSQDPIPSTLQEIYQQSYNCKNFTPLQKDLATDKLINVNKYFPANRPSWPVIIYPVGKHADKIALKWINYGVVPGYILPAPPMKKLEDFKEIQKLSKTGALAIATIHDTRPSTIESTRYYWCMHGNCPAAWYLPDGINETISYAPEGLYVSATHWYKEKKLPIPDRMITLDNKEILPWSQVQPLTLLADKIDDRRLSSYHFTPTLKERWKWLGVPFQFKNNHLETNSLGHFMLFIGGISFWVWDRITLFSMDIFSFLNENFSWVAVFIAILNIMLLSRVLFRRKEKK